MTDPHREALLQRLLPVVRRLYAETENLSPGDGDLQLWYNRGYANGMIQTFCELGYADRLRSVTRQDPPGLTDGQAFLPWGKAYRHGLEVGAKETQEAMGPEA